MIPGLLGTTYPAIEPTLFLNYSRATDSVKWLVTVLALEIKASEQDWMTRFGGARLRRGLRKHRDSKAEHSEYNVNIQQSLRI